MLSAPLQILLFGRPLQALRILLFIALLLVVGWLALSPAPPKTMNLGWDKLNHLAAFAALMISARLAWPQRPAGWQLFAALLVYGGAIELLQTLVPGRDGEWPDMLADALGLGIGLLTHAALRRLIVTRT